MACRLHRPRPPAPPISCSKATPAMNGTVSLYCQHFSPDALIVMGCTHTYTVPNWDYVAGLQLPPMYNMACVRAGTSAHLHHALHICTALHYTASLPPPQCIWRAGTSDSALLHHCTALYYTSYMCTSLRALAGSVDYSCMWQ